LTYTADEIFENAPALLKGDAMDIFDITYTPIKHVVSNWDETVMKAVREGLNEVVDGLKKEKIIKNNLELVIATEALFSAKISDVEEYLVVSGINNLKPAEILGKFEVEGSVFTISRSLMAKCPRCWKYHSENEESLCPRCASAVSGWLVAE